MKQLFLLTFVCVGAIATSAYAETGWRFETIKDPFTDKVRYVSSGQARADDSDFRVSFECLDGRDFFFTVKTQSDLTARSAPFGVQYRVDDRKPRKVKMWTYSNSAAGGVNERSAVEIVNDVLNADRLRVRAFAENGDYHDADISLRGASSAILEAVKACGLNVQKK